jgi:cobaltochelatase CobS
MSKLPHRTVEQMPVKEGYTEFHGVRLSGITEVSFNGIVDIKRINAKRCEIHTTDEEIHIIDYYLGSQETGHFYFEGYKYTLENFIDQTELSHRRQVPVNFDNTTPKAQPKKASKGKKVVVKHHQFETIKTCIKNDLPVYLVGEAGTGKNFTLQDIAKELKLDFYFTNSVQQEYKITGFIDAGGIYHETEFYKAFKNGGLFFLDEIDASIPEVLVLLNAAIANRYFEFPNGRIDAHNDFRVVAAGNTYGSGANELYTGRLVLDSATLDRFIVIEFDYDENIELMLAQDNKALVNFVRSLRKFCLDNGIRAIFSYRCIMSVIKLEQSGLPLERVLTIAVLKGLDKDTIKTLQVKNSGRYYYALKKLQGGKESDATDFSANANWSYPN